MSASISSILVALLFLTACAADLEDEQSEDLEPGSSILGSRFGIVESQSRRIAIETEVEFAIADCMKKRGFDYIPFVFTPGSEGTRISGEIPGSEEFIRKYGFGQSTLLMPQAEAPPGVIGFEGTWESRQAQNPNIEAQVSDPAFAEALAGNYEAVSDGSDSIPCLVVGQREAGQFSSIPVEDVARVEEIIARYEEETLELVFGSLGWSDEVSKVASCLNADGYGTEADLLLASTGYDTFTAIEDSLAATTDPIFFGDAELETPAMIELQARELGVAKRAQECGYNSLRDRAREVGRTFEPQVAQEMEGDMLWMVEVLSG